MSSTNGSILVFDLLGILAVLGLVAANGFFVAAEFSLVAVRRSRVLELAAAGSTNAAVLQRAVDNLDTNLALADSLRRIAGEIGASPAQVAIAWVAAQGKDIVPLVGARRRDRLTEALGALDVKLTPAHLAALAKAFPPGIAAGARYPEEHLAHMDSEKRAS